MRRPVTVCVSSCSCLHSGTPQAPWSYRQHASESVVKSTRRRRRPSRASDATSRPRTWRDRRSGTTRSSVSGGRRARLAARPLRLKQRGSQPRHRPAHIQIPGPRRRDVRRAVEREPSVEIRARDDPGGGRGDQPVHLRCLCSPSVSY